jgi:hypothetical protein
LAQISALFKLGKAAHISGSASPESGEGAAGARVAGCAPTDQPGGAASIGRGGRGMAAGGRGIDT